MEAGGLDDSVDGLKFVFHTRAIDAEGTLYLLRDDQPVAIDNCGGLAVVDEAEPTFPDVDPDSVHAGNIGRIAAAGVTTGRTGDASGPRAGGTGSA